MRKSWRLSSHGLAVVLGCLVLTTVLLAVMAQLSGWWLLKAVLLFCLLFVPGFALLRLLRVSLPEVAARMLYSLGLGVLLLMLGGLLANQGLSLVGVQHPLEWGWSLAVWSVVTIGVIVAGAFINPRPIRFGLWGGLHLSGWAWGLLCLNILTPFIAVAGAFRLNNGSDGAIALTALALLALQVVMLFVLRRRLPDSIITWLIFTIGLTILLMTSLRGWDIVGHDIQREFRVYTLTHQQAHWNIALDRDPYNACLSITILPEIISRLLVIPGAIVFKVVLQVLFAACPAVVYVLLRRYSPKLGALVGVMLFICYPTFINDSAMLTRQGVAYLFFALAILVMTLPVQRWREKVLFVLCALGAILSHYSTAYMFVGLFALAVVCKLAASWWLARRRRPLPRSMRHTVLTPSFAVLVFAMTFVWYTQITGTSGGLVATIRTSLANIPKTFSSDNKSSDTSTALLFASTKTQADLYESYLLKTRPGKQLDASASQFLPGLSDDTLPLTTLGERARAIGIDPSWVAVLRQHFAKVLQVLALAGVAYAAYQLLWRKQRVVSPDLTCLGMAGIALLGLLVVLPVLSVNYGVLRAFQQAMIFLVVPIVLLLAATFRRLHPRLLVTGGAAVVLFLFLLFTGVFAQILGGTSPSLSMNNLGLYYGLYDAPQADARSFAWIKAHIAKGRDVRAANFNRALMHDPRYPFQRSGILPSQLDPGSYVYLDQAQITQQKLYAYYDSSPLVLTFPLDYYDATKSIVYSTATTRVYR